MLWFWGALGAFMYAGPRLVRCWVTCRETGGPRGECVFEFVMSMAVGAAAGEAFTRMALTYAGIADQNGVAAVVGAFANPLIPTVTKLAPEVVSNALNILKGVKGDEK